MFSDFLSCCFAERLFIPLVPSLLSVQAQMTLKHAQAELKTKQAEVKKMDSGYKKDQDGLQVVRSSREKLQADLAKLDYEGILCESRACGQPPVHMAAAIPFMLYIYIFLLCVCIFRWEGGEFAGEKKASVQRGRTI